jgi:WD40 repeat protein
VIAGIRQKKQVRKMNDDEWESTLVMLSEHNAWEMLWRLAQTAPAERSVHLLSRLKETKWLPTQDVEQTIFRELLHLAEHCGRKQPEMLEEGVSCSATLKEHHICVLCVAISPDGKMLVSGDRNGVIYFWHLPESATPKILNMIVAACNVRGEEILLKKGTSLFDRFVERQNYLIDLVWEEGTVYENGQFNEQLSNIVNDSDVPYLTTPVGRLAMNPDGQKLIIKSRYLWLWDLSDDAEPKILRRSRGVRDSIADLIMSPDGKLLTTRTILGTIEQWSLSDGALLKTLEREIEIENCMTLTPDGQIMVSGNRDGTIRIWRLSDGVELQNLEEHTASVGCLVMSSDGQLLVSGSEDGTICLWRMPEGTLLNTLEGHPQAVTSLVMSHDGRLLTSGSNDHTIRVWSLPEGKVLQTLEGHTDRISCLAMSADGHVLASGSHDHTVRLWNLKWADLRRLSADQLDSEDLKFVENTLQQGKITEAQRVWLEFLLALAYWQKRFDVEVGEVPKGIPSGGFDVEIGA